MSEMMQPDDVESTSRLPLDELPRGTMILSCQATQIKTQREAGLRLVTMMVQGLAAGFTIFGEGWLRVAECSCYAASAIGSLLMLCTYAVDLAAMESVVKLAFRHDQHDQNSALNQIYQHSVQVYKATGIYQRPLKSFSNSLHIAALAMTLVKCFSKA